MALYAFDGTGQRDDQPELENTGDTNVARFCFAYRPNDADLPIDDRHNHYQRGIGSAGLLRRALGTITGFGGRTFVKRGLDKLEHNIERGDTVIDVVGFSRGAALALDFVNEIAKGKVRLPDGQIPTVRFLGLWDCVPSFGIAISPLNIGWDLDLPANVTRCFHALALDERRGNFNLHRPKVLGQAQQGRLTEVWFRGVHSDVGGSGAREEPPRGLASIALNWMFVNAQACGLQFDPAVVAANKAAARAEARMLDNFDPIETSFRRLRDGDFVHETVTSRSDCNNPAATCALVSDEGEARGTFGAPLGRAGV
jgi:uncharacterized protein (DUF2235 family)